MEPPFMSEEELFHRAVELSTPEARDAFLDKACRGDPGAAGSRLFWTQTTGRELFSVQSPEHLRRGELFWK